MVASVMSASADRAATVAQFKFKLCVRNARDASRDSWQHARNRAERKAYLTISRESIQDARYWQRQLS